MNHIKKTAAWVTILAIACVAAARADDIVSGDIGKKLDEYLTRITPFGFTGACLAAKDGEIILNKGYGLAIRSDRVLNTADTIFCTGSITKQFTAAAIMTLEMKGKLKTEDSLSKYFEGVPEDKAGITLHHLLTHTSGLVPDVGPDYEPASRDETVIKILSLPLEFKPGERFAYSNVNYTLLAAVIEKITGQPYEDYLRESLFKPAGMEWTGYRIPNWNERVVAHWYVAEKDNVHSLIRPFPFWNLIGNGGILSTTEDMYKWHLALTGNQVLSPEAKKKLYTPFLNDYAYGWDVLKTERGTLIQHNGGSSLGNNAEIRRYIDAGIVTVLFCNQFYKGRPLMDSVRDKIEAIVFGGDVEMPPAVVECDPAQLKKFEGAYKLDSGGLLNISARDSGLLVKAEGQEAITALAFPDAENAEAITSVGEKSARIIEAALQGNYNPFAEVSRDKEKRIPRLQDFIERRVQAARERTGQILKVEPLYTVPSGMEQGAIETVVRLKGEKGNIFFRMIWRDGINIGLGPMEMIILPISFTLLPIAPEGTEFAGYDLAQGQGFRVRFTVGPRGSATGMTIQGKIKKIEVKKS
jgi:CubicO group peptidase (beta-lactamase class C family)